MGLLSRLGGFGSRIWGAIKSVAEPITTAFGLGRLAVVMGGLIACLICCTLAGFAIENNDCCYSAAQLGMVAVAVLGMVLARQYNRMGKL